VRQIAECVDVRQLPLRVGAGGTWQPKAVAECGGDALVEAVHTTERPPDSYIMLGYRQLPPLPSRKIRSVRDPMLVAAATPEPGALDHLTLGCFG
jgi:hypothetical protein